MCMKFLTSGYEGNTMAKMFECARARKKINGHAVYDAKESKLVDEMGQRYIECGWLEKDDEKTLEVLWQKTRSNAVNRRRSRKGK